MMNRKMLALLVASVFASSAAVAEPRGMAYEPPAADRTSEADAPKPAGPKVVTVPTDPKPAAAAPAKPAPAKGEAPAKKAAEKVANLPVPKVATPTAGSVAVATPAVPQPVASTTPKIDVPVRKQERVPLPGVGALPGAKTTVPQDVVRATEGKNQIVAVSNTFANRIGTPFSAPKAVGIYSEEHVTIKQVGQSLFVQFHTDEPLALYVTGTEPGDPVISVTLVPKPMPAQTVLVQVDEKGMAAPLAAAESDRKEASSYTDKIVNMLRAAALSKAPAGFVEAPLPKAVGRMGALVVTPEVRYSNANMDVFRYRIEATGPDPVELDEAAFDGEGVRAVAFYPSGKVKRGEPVTVFVVADKTALGAAHD